MVIHRNMVKAKEIIARAYVLSDEFEATVEELYNWLDEVKERRRKQFGEESEAYKTSSEYCAKCKEILRKVQANHSEGFELLLDFIKQHLTDTK